MARLPWRHCASKPSQTACGHCGWRVRYAGGRPSLVDGPFAETKELVAGYTLIDVPSREAALEWARRFPAPQPGGAGEIEVRQLFELEDFGPGEAVERFRALGAA